MKEQTAKTIGEFMEMDNALIKGMDDGILSRLNAIYNKYDISIGNFAKSQTDKISVILKKVYFQEYNDILLKMGEDGKLSASELSAHFPEVR